jgi:protein-S-isoprenylcysteine O-methyltransferase Ste14
MPQTPRFKGLGLAAANLAWALFFAGWTYVHFRYLRRHAGGGARAAVEVLLIAQNAVLILFFLIRRAPKTVSWNPWDVVSAFLGTFAGLLFWPAPTLHPRPAGLLFEAAGCILTIYSNLSLGRSWGVLPANRTVQTRGMYRFLRHPVYASYQVFAAGYIFNNPAPYNLAVAVLSLLCQVLRIKGEEKVLSQDSAYREYSSRVRFRLLPFIW